MKTDPATLRALNVRRKQDRIIMRDTLRTICDHLGIAADIKEENRSITAHIATDSGLCATFCISPNYPDTLIHWFMGLNTVGHLNDQLVFRNVNPSRRKATSIASDFARLCIILDDKLSLNRNGEAVILPPTPTLTPTAKPNTNPTTTMQATLQSDPARVAHKATTTRDQINSIATTLRHLFKNDNDAPRLFADAFGDVLMEHRWSDPRTTDNDIYRIHKLTEKCDNLLAKLAEIS